MAPEILNGLVYGKQVDLWAFGIIIFEMISGKVPFENDQEILQKDVEFPKFFSKSAIPVVKGE